MASTENCVTLISGLNKGLEVEKLAPPSRCESPSYAPMADFFMLALDATPVTMSARARVSTRPVILYQWDG